MKQTIFIVFFILFYSNTKAQLCGVPPNLYNAHYVFFQGGNVCSTDTFHLIFADEFNSTQLDTNAWATYYPYGDHGSDRCLYCRTHGEEEIYLDTNVAVNNGTLKLTCRKQTATWYGQTKEFTSGMINAKYTTSFKYGRYEARIKIPSQTNLWPAFWAFGEGTEFDACEFGTSTPSIFHYGMSNDYNTFDKLGAGIRVQQQGSCFKAHQDMSDSFHVYAFEWSPYLVHYYVDDILINTFGRYFTIDDVNPENVTSCEVAEGVYIVSPAFPAYHQNNPVGVIANLAVGGPFNNSKLPTDLPATMEVDYIRIYQKNEIFIPSNTTSIYLYPQPCKAQFTVTYQLDKAPKSLHYSIYDITGRLFAAESISALQQNSINIDVINYPTGIYFLELKADGYSFIRKLILE